MRKNLLKNRYKGMGFVEALIAIMVTGVASVVLMGIAASTLRSLLNTEIQDKMSQLGRSGAVIAQGVADRETGELDEVDRFFFQTSIENNCFGYEVNAGEYSFNSAIKLPVETRSTYLTSLVEEEDVEDRDKWYYFRVMCVEEIIEGIGITRPRALIKVITGYTKTEGSYTSTMDIKDYEYLAVINL